MRGEDRAGAAASLRLGGIMACGIALWPTPAARGVRGGDVPPRRTRRRQRRVIGS